MSSGWEPWLGGQRKSNLVFINFLVAALLIGISFRLLCSLTGSLLPIGESPVSTGADEDMAGAKAPPLGLGDAVPKKDSLTTDSDAPSPKISLDVEEQVSEHDSLSTDSDAPSPKMVPAAEEQEKCDLFSGGWIPNPSGPAYTNKTCRFIEPPQNCMKNGCPDTGYLYWKWKPHDCNLPSFNAEIFLETMRNKSWALIGDSILRNHAVLDLFTL